MTTRNIQTREGYEYWDKLCAIPRYGFIHSPDNSRVLKTEGIGNWIDQHAAQEVVDQAQDEINGLRAEVERLTLATTEQRQIIEGLTGGMDSTTALLRIGRLETEVEGLRKAINARAPGPRSLQQVGTGALYGEQDYCFRKGWKEGVASFRKQLRAAMAAKEGV